MKRLPEKMHALRNEIISSEDSDLGGQEVTRMRKYFSEVHIEMRRAV
jgi:hypothetical protein